MPVVKIENITDDLSWGLWKIEETTESLTHLSYLSEEEERELNRITNLKRKKEWLGARVMLKCLVEDKEMDYMGTYKDDNNKPYLYHQNYHISIAHCFPYAVTLLNKKHACGIDIEKPKPALFHVASKFLSTVEFENIQRKPDDLCLAWAAKEVLFKLHGKKKLNFKENLHIEPYCIGGHKGQITAQIELSRIITRYVLSFEIMNEFIICYSN